MFQFQTHFYFIVINIFGGISKYQDTKKQPYLYGCFTCIAMSYPRKGRSPNYYRRYKA